MKNLLKNNFISFAIFIILVCVASSSTGVFISQMYGKNSAGRWEALDSTNNKLKVVNFNNSDDEVFVSAVSPGFVSITDGANTVSINADGQMHIVAEGKIDSSNSTSTPLGAGATFTGTGIETLPYAVIVVSLFADQISATDGLKIEQSTDNINWDHCDEFTIPVSTGKTFSVQPQARYLRVLYTNGATPQAVFRLQTSLKKTYVKPSSHRIQDAIVSQDDAELVKAVITGENPGGAFVNFQSTTSGNFKMSLEELENSISSNSNSQLNVTNFDSSGSEIFNSAVSPGFVNAEIKIGDNYSLDAFARLRVSNNFPIFDSKQVSSGQSALFWDDQQVSGASTTTTYSQNRASTTLSIEASGTGRRIRQTRQRFNYQPGKSQLILMTFRNDSNPSGSSKKVGYFDEDNGLFLDISGVSKYVTVRTNVSGVSSDTQVEQDSWNLDKLDGTGVSGANLDFTKMQIFVMDFEWLGTGRIRFGFVIDGIPIYCHQVLNANIKTSVYMSTPNLPIRYEINGDGTQSGCSLEVICSTVISEGGISPNGVIRSDGTKHLDVDANTPGTFYALVGIRLKSDSLGASVLINKMVAVITSSNDAAYWQLLLNPTVAGSFTYSDASNSVVQIAIGDTSTNPSSNTVTGGTLIDQGYISTGVMASISLKNSLRLGAAIDGTRDTFVLCVTPFTGDTNLDVGGGLTWREVQ